MSCRLHDSNVPLSEEVVEELEAELEPFCYTAGLKFEGSDEKTGHWRNFFIGVVGDVDAQEEDNLWPNMVLSLVLFDVLCCTALALCEHYDERAAVHEGCNCMSWMWGTNS